MGAIERTVFESDAGAAVLLPEELGMAIGSAVLFRRVGDRIELTLKPDPAEEKRKLDELLAALRAIGPILPAEIREQPEAPERRGL